MQFNFMSSIDAILPSSIVSTTVFLLLISIVYFIFKNKGLPPGPIGLPYFGYWPFIKDGDCESKLMAFKEKYGDIFSFTCTGRLYINLGSIKAIREACINKIEFFGDRVSGYSVMNCLLKDGVLTINGEPWKATRKFFVAVLKERGSNSVKTSLAGPLYDSINSTVEEIKSKKGEPLNLIEVLMRECSTIVRLTLFGDVGITDSQLSKYNEWYAAELKCATSKILFLSGTFAKYFIFPFMPNFLESLEYHKKMEKLVQDIVDDHKSTYDAENPRDIIDEYFKERDKRRIRGDPTADYFTDKVLVGSILQFIGDGALITASFTSLMMNGLLLYPEEQDKLYNEIVEVIGLDRQPTIEDKARLTYLNAYIQESIRTGDFLTVFTSQECRRETTLGGYRIPKGAILLQNFYSCHRDPETYDEPETFKPSRYITTPGKRKAEPPIMFGVGKRFCIGEGYVMMQVFLLLATIIQNFQLSLPEGEKITSESYRSTNQPICAKPRNKN